MPRVYAPPLKVVAGKARCPQCGHRRPYRLFDPQRAAVPRLRREATRLGRADRDTPQSCRRQKPKPSSRQSAGTAENLLPGETLSEGCPDMTGACVEARRKYRNPPQCAAAGGTGIWRSCFRATATISAFAATRKALPVAAEESVNSWMTEVDRRRPGGDPGACRGQLSNRVEQPPETNLADVHGGAGTCARRRWISGRFDPISALECKPRRHGADTKTSVRTSKAVPFLTVAACGATRQVRLAQLLGGWAVLTGTAEGGQGRPFSRSLSGSTAFAG